MIIKSKRVRARGSALKRALAHICDGEDNDKIILVRGNLADLEDARADALRFARQYCVRHWIVSPSSEISREQLEDLIGRLAAEFGFEPQNVVAWEHIKDRATVDGCCQHFHILVAEVDAISGGVMSSSHDYARHEKLARAVERAWGHTMVAGAHTVAVAAALDRDGDAELAATLRAGQSSKRPRESFDETDHQRAKREGLDLPRLRILVSEALQSAHSLSAFEAKLSKAGLRLRPGDKPGTPIVETSEGVLVGSFARLTGLRKEALAERLKFNETEQFSTLECPNGDLPLAAAPRSADGACQSAGTGGNYLVQRTAADRPHDRIAAPGGERRGTGSQPVGESGSAARRPGGDQTAQGRHPLKIFVRTAARRDALLDLLGDARRAAMPPLLRAALDLESVIERETAACTASDLPEPTSLRAARLKVEHEAARRCELEERVNALAQRLSERPRVSVFKRLLGEPIDRDRQAVEARLSQLERKLMKATTNVSAARTVLRTEERKFQTGKAQHLAAQVARDAEARARITVATAARRFLEKNPRTAFWGAAYLMRVAADIQRIHSERRQDFEPDLSSDWSLLPILDVWGKPYLPPPKV